MINNCNICGVLLDHDFSPYYRGKNWYVHTRCDNLRRKAHSLFSEGDEQLGKDTRGFVYVIVNAAFPDTCKIGFSHNPRARIKQANTWCPAGAFEIHDAVYDDNAQRLEGLVHLALAIRRKRRNGEWFEMNRWHAANLIRKVQHDDTGSRLGRERSPSYTH